MKKDIQPFHNPFLLLGDFLETFVHSQHFPATVKDARTGRYVICNTAIAMREDLPVDEYIGLTAYDIGKMLDLKKDVIENAVQVDSRLHQGKISIAQYRQILFTRQHSILIEEVIKKPVLDPQGKILAILSYGHDITVYSDPLFLFSLYQKYCTTKEAIKHFLQYMKLDRFFYLWPTKQELMVLLMMRKTTIAKYIAKELKLHPRTIYVHTAHLRDKLKLIELDDLLIQLRTQYE